MNVFDATRMACYVIISTTLVIRALKMRRVGMLTASIMYLSFSAFFVWLIFEATLTSMGVNTRGLRAIATPITIVMAIFSARTLLSTGGDTEMIDRIPGAVWPIVFGGIYAGLQVFVAAQWPDAPPATVMGVMASLGVLMGTLKIMWPDPKAPELPPGVSAQAGMAAPAGKKPGKVSRFFI